MAEAVVEDPHRFFCHKCSCEISSVLPDYTCPRCCSGFIEALDSQPAATDHGDESDEDVDNVQPWELLNDVFLMGMNGDPVLDSRRPGRGRRGRDGERRPGRNNRTRHTFENLMHLFVMNLNGADLGPHGNMHGGRGGGLGPEIFVGNPGDYAWGREGFDAIVTQLLNQIESTGPPPLTKEKISEIPTVLITQEEVDKSLQCSVCWENFKCDEPVRKLVCTHVYHEGCIIPWLELHGTCPVCRKPLSSEAEQATTDDGGRRQETLRSLAAQLTPFSAQQHPLTSQFRHLHRQMDDFRRLSPRTPGDASSSNGDGLPSMQNLEDVSSSGTSSSSLSHESGSGDGNSSSTNTSSGCNSSQGNMQDMDVD